LNTSQDYNQVERLTEEETLGRFTAENPSNKASVSLVSSNKCSIQENKENINPVSLSRSSRRKLHKELKKNAYYISNSENEGELVTLKPIMSRPTGCSFLGAKATVANANLLERGKNPVDIIIDSGSDITLISHKMLQALTPQPKVQRGQRINLVQVTGNATISGFTKIPMYFETSKGPIRLQVEAYIVKGMSTPLILGNDFADQYQLSIIRNVEGTQLMFGNTGRSVPVHNSVISTLVNDEGKTFRVLTNKNHVDKITRNRVHRVNKRRRLQVREREAQGSVRATEEARIAPRTCKKVKVQLNTSTKLPAYYIEKRLYSQRMEEDFYGAPDSIISSSDPFLHISNFSSFPVTISKGQDLGIAEDPDEALAKHKKDEDSRKLVAYAQFLKAVAKDLEPSNRSSAHVDEKQTNQESGPKSAEGVVENSSSQNLLKEIHFADELTTAQRTKLEEVVLENSEAFGLDGRLGHINARAEVPLKEQVKPISLPPFVASPANREVIDKQMDTWLQQGVIEPSKSPWGAPGFISYRNGKPRMVVDYRKLNELTIPDEFPLPRQEDILQTLTGSQWLSTLDALAGFTQVELADEDREKTAFRTHRGLYQFIRMPFGLRNGPAIFQRIMQRVLAPYLWIFTLVYIDDIVIFSLTFDDHLKHLDLVLKAIIAAGVTLSPKKCNLGYQSLMLLGQKVSRLGISTHKDKVDAILKLDIPKNTHELQTFLGMLTYFSAYIPFYAWIARPLFSLLKRDSKWEWGSAQQEAFNLAKDVLTNAPVRAYGIPGLGYRIYSDACDEGLAAILQQVQPIKIKDLKGTKAYDKLLTAHRLRQNVPRLVVPVLKEERLSQDVWNDEFEETTVHVERVIAYWSRTLKPAEKNYSPTEKEALALKEGLIKFQAYIEGENLTAITDHAALTWSKTFQNVNRRLLTWGTVYAAYPDLKIVHRAGRVHSNVDPISRLRRRVPHQTGPVADSTDALTIGQSIEDPLHDMYNELSSRFEEKLLRIATADLEKEKDEESDAYTSHIQCLTDLSVPYATSKTFSILIGFSDTEKQRWLDGYLLDKHFAGVIEFLKKDGEWEEPRYLNYSIGEDGLVYFDNWDGNRRLCVPETLKVEIMKDIHESLTEGAHCGYHKTYNRIAANYYWPRMSRQIKNYVLSCDVCQKIKPKRHAPLGLLKPIPIPTRPFEVVTMDFITELPKTETGHDNILVIVDKLTKYAIFVATYTEVNEVDTAKLFFKNVVAQYGLPRQVITDRDSKWSGNFWKETCRLMGIERALTTAYHPQADGQTEIMNQNLEIALRAYVGQDLKDWDQYLDGLSLSYNNSPHSITGFAPSFLLYGFEPLTHNSLPVSTRTPVSRISNLNHGDKEDKTSEVITHDDASNMVDQFNTYRNRAKQALALARRTQEKYYNKGRLKHEFSKGDLVLLNAQSLQLFRGKTGRGKKFLSKFEGPFEIIQKISPITYRLRLPVSYGIHPVLNISHLEPYTESPAEFGHRTIKQLSRPDFADLPEVEIEQILAKKHVKRGKRRIPYYLVRWKGFSPDHDEWISLHGLRNAPDLVKEWEHNQSRSKENETS
jgi:hypothetical protein